MTHELTILQFSKMLGNLKNILAKGKSFADSKKIAPEVLLQSRLAPDQFPLIKQIQVACDTAKLCASRISGLPAPKHDDQEKTWEEILKRIDETQNYLRGFSAKDFAEADSKVITNPWWDGKTLTGKDYVLHHAIPNFYFHVTTAYAILRHNGVEVGKGDYLGELPFKK